MKLWLLLCIVAVTGTANDDVYLTWTAGQARSIALAHRISGRVGGMWDLRVTSTDHSYNYKLRATWLTPEVVCASARLKQLTNGLTDEQTRQLVRAAEATADTVVLIEIDPREGSGVIPREWVATLSARDSSGSTPRSVSGTNTPDLRDFPALAGGARRDYAYDIFWFAFPLRTEQDENLFSPDDREAELSVRIYDKVGTVRWTIPASIKAKMQNHRR